MEQTRKVQGTQFDKIIRGIVEAKLYGYTLLEIMPGTDPRTGRLREVNIIERRNVLPDQCRVVKRQGMWSPGWDLTQKAYRRNYILVNTGDLGLFSATTPLILAKKFTVANYVNFFRVPTASRLSTARPSRRAMLTASALPAKSSTPHRTRSSLPDWTMK